MPANAAGVEVEGMGAADYDAGSRPTPVPPNIRDLALQHAEEDALKRYTATFSPSKFKLYQRAEPGVLGAAANFLSTPTVVDEGYKKDEHKYFVVIRTSINTDRLEAALSDSGVTAGSQNPAARKVSLTFLFVARATTSVKQFDARVTRVEVDQNDTGAKQTTGLSGGHAKLSSSSAETTSEVTGGNTVLQADQLTYSVTSPEDMNAKMLQIFSDAGFDVADYADVSANCSGAKPDLLYKVFSTSDQLGPDLRRDTFNAARRCNLNTFATGTLTVGTQDVDPVTGSKRVFVSVRAQVFDLSGPLPKLLASVGPVQYAGLGPRPEVATTNALINAATEAAQEISNQLKAKGLN
jgi:hypothetical protein